MNEACLCERQERFGLKHVFCWHSLYGYWAGIAPDAPEMAAYDPQLVWPQPTQGELCNISCNSSPALFVCSCLVLLTSGPALTSADPDVSAVYTMFTEQMHIMTVLVKSGFLQGCCHVDVFPRGAV